MYIPLIHSLVVVSDYVFVRVYVGLGGERVTDFVNVININFLAQHAKKPTRENNILDLVGYLRLKKNG